MTEYYKDYVWRNGIPYGINKMKEPLGECYKIPMDPYRKRIAVEWYEDNAFKELIYDSAWIDFRHLKAATDQIAWQKTVVNRSTEKVISHIRNQEDRLVCIETCFFEQSLCRKCELKAPSGQLISQHHMLYTKRLDPFNGVILYDSHQYTVMRKKYQIDPVMGDFSELIEECWEF